MTLVLVLASGIAFAIWRIQRATPPARPAAAPTQATAGRCPEGQWCANHGHYFRKAFADMWRCVNCGHLQPVTSRDVAEDAAHELRDEFDHIEAYANKECDA